MPGTLKWYAKLWDTCELKTDRFSQTLLTLFRKRILDNKRRYYIVEDCSGVPWWVIACIHMREASCRFDRILHNGEKILGTGKKTSLVPKDRGPFVMWEEAAIDALTITPMPDRWTIEETLMFFEKYNGLGYLKYHAKVLSPYLWSCTNHYVMGKYASDGKFVGGLVDQQLGVAALMKELNIKPEREKFET